LTSIDVITLSEEKPEPAKKDTELTAAEAAELAEVAAKAAAAKAEAAKVAAEAAAQKEYEEAAKIVAAAKAAGSAFTDNRSKERIFRREMGEPEFFRYKKDLVPARHILSEEEEEEISRRVEIPTDQTPQYKPEHVLSPEFGGTSNYESGVINLVEETRQKLDRLKNDPNASPYDIARTEEELMYLDSLHQNFYFGMNVFRTAKGGRSKLKE
jgi:colicin import membrane protein